MSIIIIAMTILSLIIVCLCSLFPGCFVLLCLLFLWLKFVVNVVCVLSSLFGVFWFVLALLLCLCLFVFVVAVVLNQFRAALFFLCVL